jgi:hypothetical protein
MKLGGALAKTAWKTQTYAIRLVRHLPIYISAAQTLFFGADEILLWHWTSQLVVPYKMQAFEKICSTDKDLALCGREGYIEVDCLLPWI